MEDCDQEALESNSLFTKIQVKYGLLRKRDLNKIVSKYYIYVLKHRHLINSSPSYSPLRREDGLEFKQHLNLFGSGCLYILRFLNYNKYYI